MLFNGGCNPILTAALVGLGLYFLLNKSSGSATPLILGAIAIAALVFLNGGIPGFPPLMR
jgi:hypothetical protein